METRLRHTGEREGVAVAAHPITRYAVVVVASWSQAREGEVAAGT